MKVLLKKDIKGIGRKGDVKNVADGYYRNFLLPQNAAVPVTERVMKKLDAEFKAQELQRAKNISAAEALRDDLRARPITIKGAMDEKGHLFGSVNAVAIEKELKKKGFDLSKLHGKIMLDGHLKEKGTHNVMIQFPEGVHAECTVIIEKQ